MKNIQKILSLVVLLSGFSLSPMLLDAKMMKLCPGQTINLEAMGVANIYGGCYPAVTIWGSGKCTFNADFEILGPGGIPCGGWFGHTYELFDASSATYWDLWDSGSYNLWVVEVRVRATYGVGFGGFEFGRDNIDFGFYAYFDDSPYGGNCAFDC